MDNFDWLETIKVNLFTLRCLGLWPNHSFYQLNFYSLYAVLGATVILCGHNLSQIIYMFYVYTDIAALTGIIFVASTNLSATLKIYYFVRHLRQIKKLFVTLNSEQFRPKNLKQVELVTPALKSWKVIYVCLCMIAYIIVAMWSITPFLNHGFQHYQLPFEAWYPVDVQVSPNYGFAYFYQLLCIWPITIGNMQLDTLIFALMMYTGTQCDILCDNLRNLEDNGFFNEKFISCVKHHKAILSFAEESNDFFNVLVLGQMATSTAVLALTMFLLSLVSPASSEGLGHLLYIAGITVQILWYCWFGNIVETKSSQITYAAYESNWFNQPQSVKRNLLIFSIRCQESMEITAINLFTLSLQTFIGILRSAWSYFALLHSVNDEN